MAIAPRHVRTLLTFLTAIAIAAVHASPPRDDVAGKQGLRRKVKEGKINACITDAVLSPAPDPVLIFENHCDVLVNITLCVKPAGEPKGYYMLLLRPHSEARHRLWMKSDTFEHKYNSCDKPHCSAPEPEC